jgi:hypothetical protein
MPPLNVTVINIIGIILYFQGLLLVLKSKFVCKFLPDDLIGMREHGNKHQVNLHNQKIAKTSLKTCFFREQKWTIQPCLKYYLLVVN